MNFFKKFFAKKETSLQDVFNALDKFDNDIKTLREFSETAFDYFGNNWKFNLEMYISSLPQDDKEIYREKFQNVMEYEKALSIWTSALQIVKGVKPVSAELLKSMPEYKTYLAKFGIEGERLFEKLNSMFDVLGDDKTSKQIENTINSLTDDVKETDTEDIVSEEIIEEDTENKNSPAPKKDEEEEDDDEEEDDNSSILPDKQEYRAQLKERILQKVRDIELRKKAIQEGNFNEENTSISDKKEVNNEKKSNKKIKNNSNYTENKDWILENFKKIDEFLSQSRQIMSAISIYKKAQSVEEYKNYGFILDTIDYLIEKGEQILSSKSDDEIEKVFGSRDALREKIDYYKNEKNNEVIIPEEDKNSSN